MQTRHNCTACRLDKCFRVGMNSDLIRKEDYKKVKFSSTTKSENVEQITVRIEKIFLIAYSFFYYLDR